MDSDARLRFDPAVHTGVTIHDAYILAHFYDRGMTFRIALNPLQAEKLDIGLGGGGFPLEELIVSSGAAFVQPG